MDQFKSAWRKKYFIKNILKNWLRDRWKKCVASSVAISLFYTSAAVPVLQANLWEQRRAARNLQARQSAREYAQLASAAGYIQEGYSPNLENLLPESGKNAMSLPLKEQARPGKSADAGVAVRSGDLPEPLLAVPYSYGELVKVRMSKDPEAPFVLLIQDAHQIESAQRNVAQTLSHVQAKLGRRLLVGLEGASGAFEINQYRTLKNKEIQKEIWEVLIQKSLIDGAEYFGLMAEREPLLWGVEDEKLYLKNVDGYRKGLDARRITDRMLEDLRGELARIKPALLAPELLRLDLQEDKFEKRQIGMSEFIRFFEGTPELNSGRYPELSKYLSLAQMERELDFKAVEAQRNALISALSKKLKPAQLNQLLQMSVAYRLGRIGYADYYRSLQDMLLSAKIDLKEHKEFNAYVRYVLMSERIDVAAMLENLDAIKKALVARLAKSPQQKEVFQYSSELRMAEKLASQEMSPEDWDAYSKQKESVARLPEKIKLLADVVKTSKKSIAAIALEQPVKNAGRVLSLSRLENAKDEAAGKPGAGADAADLSEGKTAKTASFAELLSIHEAFYDASHDRNAALTENLSAKIKETSDRFAVLIAGGFHTPGLEKEFENRAISYAVFRPRIGKITGTGTDYLHVFSPNRTPIEKMLLGERLFLKPPNAMVAHPFPGMLDVGRMVRNIVPLLNAAIGKKIGDESSGLRNAAEISGAPVTVESVGVDQYDISVKGQPTRTVIVSDSEIVLPDDAARAALTVKVKHHIAIFPGKFQRQLSTTVNKARDFSTNLIQGARRISSLAASASDRARNLSQGFSGQISIRSVFVTALIVGSLGAISVMALMGLAPSDYAYPLDLGNFPFLFFGTMDTTPRLGPTRPELETPFLEQVDANTPEHVREFRFFGKIMDGKIPSGEFQITLKKEHLLPYNAETNPEGLNLLAWLEDYEKEARVATAGIRFSQNVVYPWDTRFRINMVGVMLATYAKALVAQEKYPGVELQKIAAGEVRYNTPLYIDVIARVQAAMGIRTHVVKDRQSLPVWMISILTFMNDYLGAEYVTSSHAISSFLATKDINNQGSQYLPEESLEFVAKIRAIFNEVEQNGEYNITLAPANDPLIDDTTMTQIAEGVGEYVNYLRAGVATDVNLRRINEFGNKGKKILVDNVGGGLARVTSRIFGELGVGVTFKWLRTEEDSFFHGIGKDVDASGKIIDYSQDTTITKRDKETGKATSIPVMERMGYDSLLQNEPDGTFLLMADPDGDRMVTAQIESSDRAAFLDELGVDYLVLDENRILALYTPNQSFFMTMAYQALSLKDAGLWDNHPRFIIMTTASSAAWREWAEKNGINVVNVPVGFKEIAAAQKKIEAQMKANPDRDVVIRDVFGREVNLGVQPRMLFAGEESGGAVFGPEELIRSENGRFAVGMREKSDGEMIIIQSAMAAYLDERGLLLSDYLKELFDNNRIQGRFDVREDVVYYNQNEPDPNALMREKVEGEEKRTKNYVFFLGMAMAFQDKVVDLDAIKAILNDVFKNEGLDFSDLQDIIFVGDGVFFQFPNKVLEIRPSGTDAKSKSYAMGDDKAELTRFAIALGQYPGDSTALFQQYIRDPKYFDLVQAMEEQWNRYQRYYSDGLPQDDYVPPQVVDALSIINLIFGDFTGQALNVVDRHIMNLYFKSSGLVKTGLLSVRNMLFQRAADLAREGMLRSGAVVREPGKTETPQEAIGRVRQNLERWHEWALAYADAYKRDYPKGDRRNAVKYKKNIVNEINNDIFDPLMKAVDQIEANVRSDETAPDKVRLKLSQSDNVSPSVDLERPARVGFLPMKGDPWQVGHIFVMLQAIADEKLDKVLIMVDNSDPERKPNLSSLTIREPITLELLKVLEPFIEYTPISKEEEDLRTADGETSLFRLMQINRTVADNVQWFYMVGSDHRRWEIGSGNNARPDTAKKLMEHKARNLDGYTGEDLRIIFIERAGEKFTPGEMSALKKKSGIQGISSIHQPMDTSSTRVRDNQHWWTVPYDVFAMAKSIVFWNSENASEVRDERFNRDVTSPEETQGGNSIGTVLPIVILALPFVAALIHVVSRVMGADAQPTPFAMDFAAPDILAAGIVTSVTSSRLFRGLGRVWTGLVNKVRGQKTGFDLQDLPNVASILGELDVKVGTTRGAAHDIYSGVRSRIDTNFGLLSLVALGEREEKAREEAVIEDAVHLIAYGNVALADPAAVGRAALAAKALRQLIEERIAQLRLDNSKTELLNYPERLAFAVGAFERERKGSAARVAALILNGLNELNLRTIRRPLSDEQKQAFLNLAAISQRLTPYESAEKVAAAYQVVDGRGAVVESEGFLETVGLELGDEDSGRQTWMILDRRHNSRDAANELLSIVLGQINAQRNQGVMPSPGLRKLLSELEKSESERRIQFVHAGALGRQRGPDGALLLDRSGVVRVKPFLEAMLGGKSVADRSIQLITFNPHMLDISDLSPNQVWFLLWYSLSAVFIVPASDSIMNEIKQNNVILKQA